MKFYTIATVMYLFSELLGVLQVKLVQRLDVVRCEGDRHQDHVLLAALGQGLDGLVCLWLQPLQWPDLTHGQGTHT